MHCTVAELERRLSWSEFVEWRGFDMACDRLAEVAEQKREMGVRPE